LTTDEPLDDEARERRLQLIRRLWRARQRRTHDDLELLLFEMD